MTILSLFGTEYTISEDSTAYNSYRAYFFNEAQTASKKLHDYFRSNELENKGDFDKLVDEGKALINNALMMVLNQLTEKEIYEYSVDSIRRIAIEPLTKFDTAAESVYNQLNAIDAELRNAEAARQREIDSASSSWSGGGFGLTGALKGAAEAALLNAASGAVTKALTSGDSKKAKSAHEMKIYNLLNCSDTVNKMCNALYDDIFYLVKTYVKILKDDKAENIKICTDEEILKSNDIFNNIKSGVYNSKPEVEQQMWIKMLATYPYNPDYFVLLFNKHNEAFDEIKKLVEWYNLPMNKISDKLLSEKYNFEAITELEEAQSKKDLLLADLNKYGVSESDLTGAADKKIEEILAARKTYDGCIYETEEDCEFARNLDKQLQESVTNANTGSLTDLMDLYLDITDGSNSEKFSMVCNKNAVTMHNSIISAVKSCTDADILTSYKEKLAASKNAELNAPIIKQIDSKVKSINMIGGLNESKDKVIGAAKGLFGKAKGMFKK